MSLQRAYVNCERCYRIVDDLMGIVRPDSGKPDNWNQLLAGKQQSIFTHDGVYAARNEALRALEDEQGVCREIVRDFDIILGHTNPEMNNAIATEALNACRDCDYSTASIVDLLKKKKN